MLKLINIRNAQCIDYISVIGRYQGFFYLFIIIGFKMNIHFVTMYLTMLYSLHSLGRI